MGIEPTTSAWKAEVLPLNYTRILISNGREDRIRTCDPLVPNQVLYQAELLPGSFNKDSGAPERTRTSNRLIRSQVLYPIELRAQLFICNTSGAEDRNRTGTVVTYRRILSPVRLPVPPPRQSWSGRRDSNPRPPPWQGGVLPLNYFRIFNIISAGGGT